ncbi:unnamed protein product [Adineta ricciae]|uniref:Uncharacterized protein n=1 Tax=Adineta ricciae TaxID=249248 RepID=A0A814NBD6_ADIRI|nr:unnamed protein product [Adineta ricciae]CAF1493394.1 unnamed protein product [Adineta ricciae]
MITNRSGFKIVCPVACRHVQDNGLTRKYEDDDTFRLNVRKLLALPFVPASEVIEAFNLLADDFDDEAENLVEYFEKTWIGEKKIRGNGRKKPKFNNELWNVYERVMNNLPRSNNAVFEYLTYATLYSRQYIHENVLFTQPIGLATFCPRHFVLRHSVLAPPLAHEWELHEGVHLVDG